MEPDPEWIKKMAEESPNITPVLVERVQHAIRQGEAALADSRIDADSPAAAWLRTILRTLLGVDPAAPSGEQR